jgi:hypothetical protein
VRSWVMRASDVGVSANLWGSARGGESRDLGGEAVIFGGEWVLRRGGCAVGKRGCVFGGGIWEGGDRCGAGESCPMGR